MNGNGSVKAWWIEGACEVDVPGLDSLGVPALRLLQGHATLLKIEVRIENRVQALPLGQLDLAGERLAVLNGPRDRPSHTGLITRTLSGRESVPPAVKRDA